MGVWVCGCVGVWVCGWVGVWVGVGVGGWVCGFVGLWVCGCVGGCGWVCRRYTSLSVATCTSQRLVSYCGRAVSIGIGY